MGTKMKGLLKGIRYISTMFDEEKDQEIQIGLPTDVKHVAHIGWDGPSVKSPSWMKEYNGPAGSQSAPLDACGLPQDRNLPELPKSSRRHASESSITTESLKKDSSTKSRSSRRHHRRDSEGSSKGGRRDSEGSSRGGRRVQNLNDNAGAESSSSPTARKLPDIPKKSRRKKSKESGGSTRSSKSKDFSEIGFKSRLEDSNPVEYTSPFSDPGPETAKMLESSTTKEVYRPSRLKPFLQEEEKGSIVVS